MEDDDEEEVISSVKDPLADAKGFGPLSEHVYF